MVRVIGALADVTESKASEERILHDAIHDNLTGLPNRELFFDRLETAFLQTRRPGRAAAGGHGDRHRPAANRSTSRWACRSAIPRC